MRRIQLLVLCFFTPFFFAQTTSSAKAPNSYIYDICLAQTHNYGGIEIPVKKAYDMWSEYEYLKSDTKATPIPAGVQSASLYWEDVPGLVQKVEILSASQPSLAKIKVSINNAKGKGNAVVAFKVDGTIYWSWHIWVTDNPENGVNYTQGFETDINGNPISVQYMDRNLGAVSNSFLDDNWQKSGGLMYQWGRKDPFPPLLYKDANFYEISGEVGVLKHKQVDPANTIPVQIRPFAEIEKNMQYAVQHPITYLVNTENNGNWFSINRYKVAAPSPDYKTWDLWSDNAKGGNSNASSSNTALKNESRSYELKSELDPCPNGWRVPSYYGRETMNNNLSFFGRKNSGVNDDINPDNNQLSPNVVSNTLNGIKVYPGLGMDFTNAQNGARNIGIIPVSGGYVYYPNSAAPQAPVGVLFQDDGANGAVWSATFAYDGARVFSMISDPYRTNTAVGLHAIYNNQTHPSKSGNAVRCMKDPNMALIGDFATAYFASQKEDYRVGLENPNSYIVTDETTIEIPVSKAFSVYNQLLSDHENLPADDLQAKIMWTSNPDLLTKMAIQYDQTDVRNSVIVMSFKEGEKGNAVISLHNGDIDTPAYWSWHVWVTGEDPTLNTVTYTTEQPTAVQYNFVNPTKSKMPPLTTVFMDRNLGALSSDIDSGLANGLHYQWGRKDPMPTFVNNSSVYVLAANTFIPSHDSNYKDLGKNINGKDAPNFDFRFNEIGPEDFLYGYTKGYQQYGSKNTVEHFKITENLKYSVQHPMTFLYQPKTGAVYNGGNHYSNDLSLVRDWVDDRRAQADNRWGHADKKSPFDPCPEGWRVPDVSFTNLYTGSKGNSPWYNGYKNDAYGKPGVIQDQWHNITTFYNGQVAGDKGWKFENTIFPIGNFPKDGIRGELGENEMSYDRSGVWTASMADLHTGYALAMQFQGNQMQTGTGVYPQAGMSVRCAKDDKRLLGTERKQNPKPIKVPKKAEISVAENKGIQLYPNPVIEEFKITTSDAESVEIYDMSGKLVLKTTLKSGSVNASRLNSGLYLVKITMKDRSVVTKKIIKQ